MMQTTRRKLAKGILAGLLLVVGASLPAMADPQMAQWLQEEQMRQAYQRQQWMEWQRQEQFRQMVDRQQLMLMQQQEQYRQMADRQQLMQLQQQERLRQMQQIPPR